MFSNRREITLDGVTYAPGARFRVTRAARLVGVVAVPGAAQGWSQELRPGDVITCTGHGPGMGSDPGYGVEFTSDHSEKAGAFHCDFRPQEGGMWNYHPAAGFLEPA